MQRSHKTPSTNRAFQDSVTGNPTEIFAQLSHRRRFVDVV
jgi:hypothetical protein